MAGPKGFKYFCTPSAVFTNNYNYECWVIEFRKWRLDKIILHDIPSLFALCEDLFRFLKEGRDQGCLRKDDKVKLRHNAISIKYDQIVPGHIHSKKNRQ